MRRLIEQFYGIRICSAHMFWASGLRQVRFQRVGANGSRSPRIGAPLLMVQRVADWGGETELPKLPGRTRRPRLECCAVQAARTRRSRVWHALQHTEFQTASIRLLTITGGAETASWLRRAATAIPALTFSLATVLRARKVKITFHGQVPVPARQPMRLILTLRHAVGWGSSWFVRRILDGSIPI